MHREIKSLKHNYLCNQVFIYSVAHARLHVRTWRNTKEQLYTHCKLEICFSALTLILVRNPECLRRKGIFLLCFSHHYMLLQLVHLLQILLRFLQITTCVHAFKFRLLLSHNYSIPSLIHNIYSTSLKKDLNLGLTDRGAVGERGNGTKLIILDPFMVFPFSSSDEIKIRILEPWVYFVKRGYFTFYL